PPLLGDPPGAPRHLHSFPTRRSSDLGHPPARGRTGPLPGGRSAHPASAPAPRHAVRNLGPPATPARPRPQGRRARVPAPVLRPRSEEHTSELQSRENLVCRLLLEKKN